MMANGAVCVMTFGMTRMPMSPAVRLSVALAGHTLWAGSGLANQKAQFGWMMLNVRETKRHWINADTAFGRTTTAAMKKMSVYTAQDKRKQLNA